VGGRAVLVDDKDVPASHHDRHNDSIARHVGSVIDHRMPYSEDAIE